MSRYFNKIEREEILPNIFENISLRIQQYKNLKKFNPALLVSIFSCIEIVNFKDEALFKIFREHVKTNHKQFIRFEKMKSIGEYFSFLPANETIQIENSKQSCALEREEVETNQSSKLETVEVAREIEKEVEKEGERETEEVTKDKIMVNSIIEMNQDVKVEKVSNDLLFDKLVIENEEKEISYSFSDEEDYARDFQPCRNEEMESIDISEAPFDFNEALGDLKANDIQYQLFEQENIQNQALGKDEDLILFESNQVLHQEEEEKYFLTDLEPFGKNDPFFIQPELLEEILKNDEAIVKEEEEKLRELGELNASFAEAKVDFVQDDKHFVKRIQGM